MKKVILTLDGKKLELVKNALHCQIDYLETYVNENDLDPEEIKECYNEQEWCLELIKELTI